MAIKLGTKNILIPFSSAYLGDKLVYQSLKKIYVAVGNSGTSYYSQNGTTWNPMTGLDTSCNYNSVCFGNDRFVTVGTNCSAYYSVDGTTWEKMSGISGTNALNSVCYGNGKFVCVGASGKSCYSTDGATWKNLSGLSSTATDIVIAGSWFVCLQSNGLFYYLSSSGTAWSEGTIPYRI